MTTTPLTSLGWFCPGSSARPHGVLGVTSNEIVLSPVLNGLPNGWSFAPSSLMPERFAEQVVVAAAVDGAEPSPDQAATAFGAPGCAR